MKKDNSKWRLFITVFNVIVASSSYAGEPVFKFTPIGSTTLTVYQNTSHQANYRITNQSKTRHTLGVLPLPTGVTVVTTGQGACSSTRPLSAGSSCLLSLLVTGGTGGVQSSTSFKPKVCQIAANGAPSPYLCYQAATPITINYINADSPYSFLTVSPSFLAVNVGGKDRIFTITNNGPNDLVGTPSLLVEPSLPSGTSANFTGCTNLATNTNCTLTISPGNTPTNSPGTLNPIVNLLIISGTSAIDAFALTEIVTFGNFLQDGFIFYINDFTLNTTSIGGSVLAEQDLASFYPWGGSGTIVTPNTIDDGLSNTSAIVSTLTGLGIASTSYAAGQCSLLPTNGLGSWYLPALCQWINDSGAGSYGCSTPTSNVNTNLLNVPNVNFSNGRYWSSTQSNPTVVGPDYTPDTFAVDYLPLNQAIGDDPKTNDEYVRCARNLQ